MMTILQRLVVTVGTMLLIVASSCVVVQGSTRELATTEETTTIKVMTFNIMLDGKGGKQPLSQTAKVIETAEADIVGLQEVWWNAKAIANLLGWYYVQQGYDTAVLSRFEILGTTPNKLGVKIRHPSGATVFLVNVHLKNTPYQPFQLLNISYHHAKFLRTESEAIAAATKARGGQVARIMQEIENIGNKNVPVFITGDFNEPSYLDWTQAAADLGEQPLKVAYPSTHTLANDGFVDAYRAIYPDETTHTGLTWTPITSPDDPKDHHDRIDFVLCRGNNILSIDNATIVGEAYEYADVVVDPWPSDHRTVVATFTIRINATEEEQNPHITNVFYTWSTMPPSLKYKSLIGLPLLVILVPVLITAFAFCRFGKYHYCYW